MVLFEFIQSSDIVRVLTFFTVRSSSSNSTSTRKTLVGKKFAAFSTRLFSLGDDNTHPISHVKVGVITSRGYFKILDSVVGFYTILVMDNLKGLKWSAEMLFHYLSVEMNRFLSIPKNKIPSIRETTSHIWLDYAINTGVKQHGL